MSSSSKDVVEVDLTDSPVGDKATSSSSSNPPSRKMKQTRLPFAPVNKKPKMETTPPKEEKEAEEKGSAKRKRSVEEGEGEEVSKVVVTEGKGKEDGGSKENHERTPRRIQTIFLGREGLLSAGNRNRDKKPLLINF